MDTENDPGTTMLVTTVLALKVLLLILFLVAHRGRGLAVAAAAAAILLLTAGHPAQRVRVGKAHPEYQTSASVPSSSVTRPLHRVGTQPT